MKGLTLASAIALCACAHPAMAATTSAPQSLDIYLTGHVAARCGFKTPPASSLDLHDLSQGGSASVGFTLDCNTPFEMRAASSNGGLQSDHDSANGFTDRVDYNVGLSFATDLGSSAATIAAADLPRTVSAKSGASVSSGSGVAIGTDGSITVSWKRPDGDIRRVAGAYRDTITIVVEARS